jgi:YihY family inner membrane protein
MRTRLFEIGRLLHDAYQEFNRDAGAVIAGAIAFFATLALVPVALLTVSLLGHFLGSAEAFAQVERVMQQLLPGVSQQVLEALRAYSLPSRLLVNTVGTLGLLWSGMNLFALLSQILTTIWIGPPARGFVAQRLVGVVCLFGGGLLFLANIVLTSFAAALSSQEHRFGPFAQYFRYFLSSALPHLLSGALAALTFFLLYRFLPAGKVSTRAALTAALPAALLWLLSRYLFALLVAGSSRYGQLYGPLAGAVVLLLWIYYSAYIMIFCAELGVTAQQRYWPKT